MVVLITGVVGGGRGLVVVPRVGGGKLGGRGGRCGGRGGAGLERNGPILPPAPGALVAAVQLNLLHAEQAHAVPAGIQGGKCK